ATVGFWSSSPNTAKSGQDKRLTMLRIGVGRAEVVSASGVARWINPPQQSTAASTILLLQANNRVWRPPEQKPMAPILAEAPGNARRCAAAASRSCTASASDLPNITGKTVLMSLGSDGPPLRA